MIEKRSSQRSRVRVWIGINFAWSVLLTLNDEKVDPLSGIFPTMDGSADLFLILTYLHGAGR